MLVDFRRVLPCAERVLGITAGEYASRFKRSQSQTEWIDEANAGYLITSCMPVAQGAARAIST